MTAIPKDSLKSQATTRIIFPLSRTPRFDVAAPIVWQAWHSVHEQGCNPITVTWLPEHADLLEIIESSAPWNNLFAEHPELKPMYDRDFWATDAKYPEIVGKMDRLNQHLASRTVLLGTEEGDDKISFADVLLWGVIRANHISSGMIFNDPRRTHLLRWFKYLDAQPALEAVRRAHRLAKNKVENERRRRRSCGEGLDAILPAVEEGGVVVRFECSSSSFLHVGQLKELLVNRYFADKHSGHLLLRFNDLRPLSEAGDFVNDIIADLGAIGLSFDRISRVTDHLDAMRHYARQLIQTGNAYMDDAPDDIAEEMKLPLTPSPRRDTRIEVNLERFEAMLMGTGSVEGRWVVRARIDSAPDAEALRDPIILFQSAISGNHVWPTHYFAGPIVDHCDGVTHVIRTIDSAASKQLYMWFVEQLGLRPPVISYLPPLDIECGPSSHKEVEHLAHEGLIRGWDDPRVGSVRGILARGMTPAALKKHVLDKSEVIIDTTLSWDELWYANRRAIDTVVPRYWAISDIGASVVAKVEGINRIFTSSKPLNKLNAEVGTKLMVYTTHIFLEQVDVLSLVEGEEITLMDFTTAVVRSLIKAPSPQGTVVKSLTLALNPHGNPKLTSKRFHWLPAAAPTAVLGGALTPVVLVKYPRPNYIGQCEVRTPALASPQVGQMRKGDILQFERKGFYVCHGTAPEGGLEFVAIPEGRSPRRRSTVLS